MIGSFVANTAIVSAVQFEPKLLDVRQNLTTGLQLAFEACAKGARVVVLPELCTSGYVLRNGHEATQCAQDRHGYQTEAFGALAQRFGCHIVFGYVELCEGKLYNSAAVVGPQGLEGSFQKHNLWGSDQMWAQPSEMQPITVLSGAGRLGVLICRDAGNNFRESYYAYDPQHRFYRAGSIDTIALLTNWGSSYGYPDSTWVELAEKTRANVIVSNRVGKERDIRFKGGSAVIDRDRRIYTHGSNFTSEAVVGGVAVL